MLKSFALALVLLCASVSAETYDYSKKWGIGGNAGYNTPVFGNTFNDAADGGETWGIHGRYHLSSSYGLELGYTRREFSDVKSALQVSDLTFFKRLNPTDRLSTVLGLGAGVVDISHYDPSSLKLGLKARAGLEYALNQAFSLGLNVDYQHVNKMLFGSNLPGRNINVVGASLGLTWYFCGPKETKAAPAVVATAPVTDKDSDNDGVVDRLDKCPNTAQGVTVNAYGCAEKEAATVHLNVKFAVSKADIDSNYDSDLKELSDFMNEHKTTKIEIQGHTDSSGGKALNKKISQARADAVKAYLVNKLGVDGSRLMAVGHGDEMPVGDNKTVEGKQANRRVVAVITQ